MIDENLEDGARLSPDFAGIVDRVNDALDSSIRPLQRLVQNDFQSSQVLGGRLRAGDETLEARVFPLSDLPWGEMAFPSTVEALREYVRRFGS